jgi:predicted short-subunit dehydrogenase-like oxidoreductase (DUF2520 family)
MTRILLIGTGRMAYQLGHAIAHSKLDLVGVAGRNVEERERLARFLDRKSIDLSKPLPAVDLILVAVSDDAIATVAGALRSSDAVVAHTAGAMGLDVLDPHEHRGVLWPIQSFSHGTPMDLSDVPMVVDANDEQARKLLHSVAGALSEVVLELPLEQRQRVHLAAVLTSNMAVWLAREAQRLLREQKLPPSLLTPLWKATAAKAAAFGPEQALTGPARRGDTRTIQHHLDLLTSDPDLRAVYSLLSEQILRAYGHGKA